ncbi:MAG: mandelate racemase/muconate lactonizing enzyme family protein [Nitrospiria bacterium]
MVKLEAEDGTVGYGEGVARPYVTGETVEISVDHIIKHLWPVVREGNFTAISLGEDPFSTLNEISNCLPEIGSKKVIAWHAARTAMELALVDCLLKREMMSLGAFLPPRRNFVTYSGVITGASINDAVKNAKYFKLFGLRQIKIKIGDTNDLQKIAAIRDAIGPETSMRVDANGAYTLDQATRILEKLEPYRIDCVEQPLPRGNLADLARLRQNTSIPIMVDESLITISDAEQLIKANACDYFNLRLSKCGGLLRTLELADIARKAGIRIQLGCQVGETAILSAAGRHVAAYLDCVDFVEGSYGALLLSEDITQEPIQFGHGGKAPVLRRPGLGVAPLDRRLSCYSQRITWL